MVREQEMRIRTHPGEVLLEEFLKPNSITPDGLALALDVPPMMIRDIVAERGSLSADACLRLARYFHTSAEFWINLQTAHDLSVAANELDDVLEHIVPFEGEARQPAHGDYGGFAPHP